MGASGAQRAGGGRGVDEGLEGSRGSGGLRAGQEVSPQLLWMPGVPGVHWGAWCRSGREVSPGCACSVRPELRACAIPSLSCLFLAAAEMRGLIRVTNDGGACDLQESFGCNYVGHQVKESLLD